jgi:branched-chain amino acid transport system ATP-binding protein/urea transport system ATP-binding protein
MLVINHLHAGYGNSQVLNDFSITVPAGEVLALMGRNGMGKTTLLKATMGLLPIAAGEIRFDNHSIVGRASHDIARLGLGYVPQGREIFDDFTVLENLRLGLMGHASNSQTLPEQIFSWFPVLRDRADQRAGSFSGGQQQMLAIARALVSGPKMLLLDEPTEGIQPSLVHDIGLRLREIARDTGLTILLVEQNVDIVRTIADQVIFMENGKAVEQVPVGAIRQDDALLARHLTL